MPNCRNLRKPGTRKWPCPNFALTSRIRQNTKVATEGRIGAGKALFQIFKGRIIMHLRATAFLLASSALTLAVPAYAQDTAAEDDSAENSIVVTGTRIVRDGYEAPTPVTVAISSSVRPGSS